jgi:aliphatic nitrilase
VDLGFICVAKASCDPTGRHSLAAVVRLLLNRKPASRVHAFDPEYTEVGRLGEETQRQPGRSRVRFVAPIAVEQAGECACGP